MDDFAALLWQHGYDRSSGWLKIRLAAALSRWLLLRRIALKDLDEPHDAASLGHRTVQLAAGVLRSLLGFLFQKGRIAINLTGSARGGKVDACLIFLVTWRRSQPFELSDLLVHGETIGSANNWIAIPAVPEVN